MKIKITGTQAQLDKFFTDARYFQNQDSTYCRPLLTSTWPEQCYMGQLNPKVEDAYTFAKTLAHSAGCKIEPIE